MEELVETVELELETDSAVGSGRERRSQGTCCTTSLDLNVKVSSAAVTGSTSAETIGKGRQKRSKKESWDSLHECKCHFSLVSRTWFWVDCWWQCFLGWVSLVFLGLKVGTESTSAEGISGLQVGRRTSRESGVVMNGGGEPTAEKKPSGPRWTETTTFNSSKSLVDSSGVAAGATNPAEGSDMSVETQLGQAGDSGLGRRRDWCYNGTTSEATAVGTPMRTSSRARSSSSSSSGSGRAVAVRRIGIAGLGSVDLVSLGLEGVETPNVRRTGTVAVGCGSGCGSSRGGTEREVEEATAKEQEKQGAWKPVGVGTQLLSLSVVVAGLIGTVAVPLNIALFFTIISSSCALALVWIFFIIRSYLHHHRHHHPCLSQHVPPIQDHGKDRDRGSLSTSRALNALQSSGQLVGRSGHNNNLLGSATNSSVEILNQNVSGQFFQLIKDRAESQVENYLFSLWWLLSVCDWLCSVVVLFINAQYQPYVNLSLESFSWAVHVLAAAFAPTVIISFWSWSIFPSSGNQRVIFPPRLCTFLYVLFVRRLGAFFFAPYFPYTLLIQVTSVVGLIIGRVAAHHIFTTVPCCPIFSETHPATAAAASLVAAEKTHNFNPQEESPCVKNYQDKDDISSDYSDNPANLRRRSSGNLNGLTLSSTGLGLGARLPKKEGPLNSVSSQTQRSASIPSVESCNYSRRLSNCAPSDSPFEGEGSANRSSSLPSSSLDSIGASTVITPAVTDTSRRDREKTRDPDDDESRKADGEEQNFPPSESSATVNSSSKSSGIGQFHHQDQDRRRAVNTFSLSRCQSAVHIVSGQHREVEKMRRTSLPAALPAQRHTIHHGSGGVDTALLLEAHGLVTDMLMDHAALPAHIVAGLKALATLLTPPPLPMMHYQNQRPRPAPLMLSTDPEYTSDIDEIPYTGEKIWCMPKRNSGPCKKGGVSANLLRRMSTSTWTTTTSATGMPTLEPQPHARRRRSASFRSAIDGTPGSSPTQPYGMIMETAAMRLQSTIATSSSSAHVPNAALQASHKSRSFSANALYASSDSRRRFSQQELSTSQRKTVCSLHPLSPSDLTHLSALAAHSSTAATSSSVLSSPAGTPIPSPLPSPHPSRDPSPSVNPDSVYLRSSSPPKLLFHPRSSSFAVPTEDGAPGKTYLENPDDDNGSTLGDGPGPPLTSYNFPDNLGSSHRLSPVTFTLQEPTDDQPLSSSNDDDSGEVVISSDGIRFDLMSIASDPVLCRLNEWDYPIFDLEINSNTQILSHMCYKVFLDVGLFETFKIPIKEFINYFHALEMGYRDKPYHNRMHAADVLHGVYYLTSQPIPGFEILLSDPETPCAADATGHRAWFNVEESSYGIMGANFPALELMAMYTAAAMHDYDHPGRTNAFLVTTHAPQAILYNDRSVLENHHAAAAWSLLLSSDECNFLKYLDKAEFKRFRYLVIEAILATDLKRHFEILAEFNAKANEDDSPGIDWNLEADRLLVMEMCIKLADINGPCKYHDIHVRWTYRIAEEFYEQGDEEEELGLPISPYMDRKHPQLAKLQESFINHLVAPLCKACAEAGILPGFWEEEEETADEVSSCQETDNENDSSYSDDNSESKKSKRKIICLQTQHLQDNHRYWMNVIKEETRKKDEGVKTESVAISTEDPMETIEEENNTPHSLNRSFSFEKEDSKL